MIDHLVQTVLIDYSWNCRLFGIKSSGSPAPTFPGEETKAGRGEARTRWGSRSVMETRTHALKLQPCPCQGYFIFLFHWVKTPHGHSLKDPPRINLENRLGHNTAKAYYISLNWWLSWRLCLQCGRPGFHSLGLEDPLKKEMATHSSILAWRIPWTEKPGGRQSMGSQKTQTQLSDSLSLSLSITHKT